MIMFLEPDLSTVLKLLKFWKNRWNWSSDIRHQATWGINNQERETEEVSSPMAPWNRPGRGSRLQPLGGAVQAGVGGSSEWRWWSRESGNAEGGRTLRADTGEERAAQMERFRGLPSAPGVSLQRSTDKYMHVRKWPEARERAAQKEQRQQWLWNFLRAGNSSSCHQPEWRPSWFTGNWVEHSGAA